MKWLPTQWSLEKQIKSEDSGLIQIEACYSDRYKGVKYAVRKGGVCLAKDGEMEYEPMSSSRDDDFYKRCRFDSFKQAQKAAQTYFEKRMAQLAAIREKADNKIVHK